jgi:hypothetical protein
MSQGWCDFVVVVVVVVQICTKRKHLLIGPGSMEVTRNSTVPSDYMYGPDVSFYSRVPSRKIIVNNVV